MTLMTRRLRRIDDTTRRSRSSRVTVVLFLTTLLLRTQQTHINTHVCMYIINTVTIRPRTTEEPARRRGMKIRSLLPRLTFLQAVIVMTRHECVRRRFCTGYSSRFFFFPVTRGKAYRRGVIRSNLRAHA